MNAGLRDTVAMSIRTHLAAAALLLATGFSTCAFAGPPTPGTDVRRKVPGDVLRAVHSTLPDGRRVRRALLSPTFDPNLAVSAPTSVEVTFLWDAASFRNAFGYFTWRAGGASGATIEIVDRQLVFADASRDALRPGDTVKLRDADGEVRIFEPGTRIGFFVVADGASLESPLDDAPSEDPQVNAGLARGVFTTVDALNPEIAAGQPGKARHTAMLSMPGRAGFLKGQPFFVLGMEDARRDAGADQDFNDLVFVVRSTQVGALGGTHVLTAAPDVAGDTDPDGDGLHGLQDFFPEDATRGSVASHAPTTLAGRDAVPVPVATEQVLDAAGAVREIVATFHRDAQAAAEVLTLPGLPADARGTVFVERFLDTGEHVAPVHARLEGFLQPAASGKATLRYPRLFRAGEGGETRVIVRLDTRLPGWSAKRAFPWRLEGAPGAFTGPRKLPATPLLPQVWTLRPGR